MGNKRKVYINIQGIEYPIIGDVSEEHITKLASFVDEMISDIIKNNIYISKNKAAILCSLNIADELSKAKEIISALEEKVNGIEDIHDLKAQLKNLSDYAESNLKQNNRLQDQVELLELELMESKELIEQYKEKAKQSHYEIEASRKTILDLQNQLFESQIQLVKANKKEVNNS